MKNVFPNRASGKGIKWTALISGHHSVDEHNAALEAGNCALVARIFIRGGGKCNRVNHIFGYVEIQNRAFCIRFHADMVCADLHLFNRALYFIAFE